MTAAVPLDLSGVGVEVSIPERSLAAAVAERWAKFAVNSGDPVIHVAVETLDEHLSEGAFRDKRLVVQRRANGIDLELPEGRATVEEHGAVRLRIPQGPVTARVLALDNVLLAALSLTLPSRSSTLLLHGACALFEGRGVVLLGAAGAGKSTWAGHACERGGAVLSDDLVFVAVGGRYSAVLASPFRAERNPDPRPGRYPLRAILVPEHSPDHALDRLPILRAVASVTGGLLYDAAAHSAAARELAEHVARTVPVGRLRFAPDPGWVDAMLRSGF